MYLEYYLLVRELLTIGKGGIISDYWHMQVSPVSVWLGSSPYLQPLTTIFSDKKGNPPLAAARLQRWALQLSAHHTIPFGFDQPKHMPMQMKCLDYM